MKIKSKRFYEIVASAQEIPDRVQFLAEYGLPLWITDEVISDEEEAVKLIDNIHHVVHLTPKELIAEAGLTQSTFSRRFNIPIRTVQDWCGDRRKMPDYLKMMVAEILGFIKIQIEP